MAATAAAAADDRADEVDIIGQRKRGLWQPEVSGYAQAESICVQFRNEAAVYFPTPVNMDKLHVCTLVTTVDNNSKHGIASQKLG